MEALKYRFLDYCKGNERELGSCLGNSQCSILGMFLYSHTYPLLGFFVVELKGVPL